MRRRLPQLNQCRRPEHRPLIPEKHMIIESRKLLDCAISAAKEAGNHALRNISRRKEVLKTFQHDVKLVLDAECQAVAARVIQSAFPKHAILGEEDSTAAGNSSGGKYEYQWVIDPIDGTVNFSHGLPNWCCSIAVRSNGVSVAGAVYLPVIQELYTAANDLPASRNGEEIHVSTVSNLSKAIVMTGIDKNEGTAAPPFEIFRRISVSTQKTRVMGAAAADLCQVASGRAEGYYESGIYIWDVAAAGLIVERAGGKAEIIGKQDSNRLSFLATNGRIHSSLQDLIRS